MIKSVGLDIFQVIPFSYDPRVLFDFFDNLTESISNSLKLRGAKCPHLRRNLKTELSL